MFFDVLILVIIVVCAVFGFRNGFLISLSRIGGWIGALIVALLFRDRFSNWLLENTDLYQNTQVKVENVCRSFVENYASSGDPSGGAGGFSATLMLAMNFIIPTFVTMPLANNDYVKFFYFEAAIMLLFVIVSPFLPIHIERKSKA